MVKGKMKSLLVCLATGTLAIMAIAIAIMFSLPHVPMTAIYVVIGMGVIQELFIRQPQIPKNPHPKHLFTA